MWSICRQPMQWEPMQPCYHQWCLVVHLPLDLLPQEPPLWILHTPSSRVVPTLSLESSSRTCSTLSLSMSSTRLVFWLKFSLVTKSFMYMLNTWCFVLACVNVWCLMCVNLINPAWDLDFKQPNMTLLQLWTVTEIVHMASTNGCG